MHHKSFKCTGRTMTTHYASGVLMKYHYHKGKGKQKRRCITCTIYWNTRPCRELAAPSKHITKAVDKVGASGRHLNALITYLPHQYLSCLVMGRLASQSFCSGNYDCKRQATSWTCIMLRQAARNFVTEYQHARRNLLGNDSSVYIRFLGIYWPVFKIHNHVFWEMLILSKIWVWSSCCSASAFFQNVKTTWVSKAWDVQTN